MTWRRSEIPPASRAPGIARELLTFAVLCALYFVAAKAGLTLAFVNASASPVWPPTGLAIAATLVLGPRALPAIFAGAFLANLTNAGTLATSLAIAVGNTLEAAAAAYLVTRWARGRRAFERPRDVFAFTLLCAFVATPVSATIGVGALVIAGFAPVANAPTVWLTWWLGDAAGALVFAPALILWANEPHVRWSRRDAAQAAAILATAAGIAAFLFTSWGSGIADGVPLEFLCIPPIVWAAYRFGQREAATLAGALSLVAVIGTLRDNGPFVRPDPNGSLLLLQAFVAVVTLLALPLAAVVAERRRAEAELRVARDELAARARQRGIQLDAARGRFASFMAHLPGLAWIKDDGGRYVYANEAFAASVGRSTSAIAGASDIDLFGPRTAARHARDEAEVISSGASVTFTETLVIGAQKRELLVNKFPIGDPGDRDVLVGAIAVDITDQQRALDALRESEERFRLGFDNAPIGIALVGIDGKWLRVNRALCEILGYSPDELLGRRFQDITHPDDLDTDLGLVKRVLANEIKAYTIEHRCQHKDGHIVWIQLDVSLVRASDGSPVHFISQIQDITARREMLSAMRAKEAELQATADELARSNKDLQQFAYVASHDLQAPLRHAGSYAEILETEYADRLDERGRKQLSYIREGVDRMQQLIDDLLAYSRVERQPRQRARVDLADAVQGALRLFRDKLGEIGASVTVRPLATIDADPIQIRQVFQNLVDNAIKFRSPERPLAIEVACTRSGQEIEVTFADNGRGFDPRFEERIFEMFQRLQTPDEVKGSGMGLAISRRIMERHGGRIWARTRPGVGTVFHLAFPAPHARIPSKARQEMG